MQPASERDGGDILKNITARVFRRGDVVFREDSPSDGTVYFILSGTAAVLKKMGGQARVIHTLQKNEIFGEVALLTQGERIATIMAESEELKVACFDGNSFIKEARSNPKFSRRLATAALSLLDRVEGRVFADGATPPAVTPERLAEYESLMATLRTGNLRIQKYLYRSTVKTVQRDFHVFKEGTENDELAYLLLSGEVSLEKNLGGRPLECLRWREGEWLGETTLLRRKAREYSVRVVSPQARVLHIDRDIFFKTMELDPELLFNVFKSFVMHVQILEKGANLPSIG